MYVKINAFKRPDVSKFVFVTLVSGQKGFGADIVSTASPAFIVFLDLRVLPVLPAVRCVPVLFKLFPLKYVHSLVIIR